MAEGSLARLLGSIALTNASCVLPSFLLGAMAVQVRPELGLDDADVGVAIGVFFVAASLGSPLLGRLGERLGPWRSMRIAAAVSALVSLLIATTSRSLATLLPWLAVGGTTNALCQPASNLLIARIVPARRQGFAFAVKQAAIPVSTLLSGLAVPAIAVTLGWRWGYVAAAGVAVASGVLVRPVGWGEVAAVSAPPPGTAPDAPRAILLLFAVGLGFGSAAGGTLGNFLVSAAVDVGYSEAAAGWLLAGGSLLGASARLLVGVRADRRDGGHLKTIVAMLVAGAASFVLLSFSGESTYAVVAALAFCTAWGWTGLFNLALVRVNPTRPGAATGIVQTGTYLGAVAGPILFGTLAAHAGFGAAWRVAAACAAMAALAIVGGRAWLLAWRRDAVLPPLVTPPPA